MSAGTVTLLVICAALFGSLIGYMIRMIVENTADERIRTFIVFAIEKFFNHENVTLTPAPQPGGLTNLDDPKPMPPPQYVPEWGESTTLSRTEPVPNSYSVANPPKIMPHNSPPLPDIKGTNALRYAMEHPRSEDEKIEKLLVNYDPKKIRAALSRLQVRAGGKFAKA